MSTFSVKSLKGKRRTNEDQHITPNRNSKYNNYKRMEMYAVFDGHGGDFVSGYLKKNFPKYFVKTSELSNKKYIYSIFDSLQKNLYDKYYNESKSCGSTCLAMIKQKNKLILMNSGDCRAVLCHNNLAIPLTKDHKPYWYDERKRIERLNGKIYFDGDDWRIESLSVSRSLGDFNSQPYVTHLPEIFRYSIAKDDKFIIIGCDGIWDVVSNQEAVHFVLENYRKSVTKIADMLAEYAIKKGSTDNVTIIIVFL